MSTAAALAYRSSSCMPRSGTCESWDPQLPAFTAAGYRCITYDRRGWGRSRPDPTGEQPGYVSDDLHRLVDHLGLDRFHVAATAAGGIGALDYALAHPERVRSLVVADSIGGVQDPEYLEVQHRLRPPEIQALPWELRELSAGYRGMNPEGTQRWIAIERGSRLAGAPGAGAAAAVPDDVGTTRNTTGANARARWRSRPRLAAGTDAHAGGAYPRLPIRDGV